jgi:mono/diheme cytochrome c family protein/glucose/arabinose dehydrogenase
MRFLRSRFFRRALPVLALVSTAVAQIGDRLDKPGSKQESLVPKDKIPAAPALPPADALKSFKVAPGFRVELVASEPLIGDPVAMAFGPDGRIWVVEMRGYMHDVDGHGEDLKVGRVVVLTDTDGDGRMDKSDVFADGLVMPRAIMLVNGGVLVGAPPELLFLRDTDGDGKADQRTVVNTDFGLAVIPERPEVSNPERAPNGLLWGRDNFIYGAAYETRYRLSADGKFEPGPTSFRGQWGLSQDDRGHFFHNSNSDQLRGDVTPANYLLRNPAFLSARGTNVKVATNQNVWPIRVNPGVNRGYQTTIIKPNGKLGDFTAACSPYIYRGEAFGPEFYGNAFVAEPAANLVKRNLVTAKNGTLTSTHAYPDTEFLASTDERFRPVFLTDGPDGALYVVDLYRGILQHRISLTTYLRQQIKDRGLENPIGLGRIYRIVPDGAHPKNAAAPKTAAEWVARLAHPNGWWRDLAQQKLVESRDPAATAPLRALARNPSSPLGQLFALATLSGRGELDRETVSSALQSKDAPVRVTAIRVSETFLRGDTKAATLAELARLKDDADPEVQLQLVLSLGEAGDPAADRLMADLVRTFPTHPFLADAAVSGLGQRELTTLEQLTADPAWKETTAAGDRFLALLAACVFNRGDIAQAARALDALIAAGPAARQNARLTAFAATVEHGAAMPKPSAPFKALLTTTGVRTQAERIANTLLLPADGKPRPVARPLKSGERALYDQGAILFGMNCAACHQPDGKGRDGLAPPLVDSEWATGTPSRPARVIMHGLTGPIEVKGQTIKLDMPAFGFLKDEQIAAVLTYVRRAWGNRADPVTVAQIQEIRAATAQRQRAWTAEELLAVP